MRFWSKCAAVLALSMLCVTCSGLTSVAAQGTIDMTTSEFAKTGAKMDVKISVSDMGNLCGGKLLVGYDSERLKPVSYAEGDLTGCYTSVKLDYDEDKCSFVFANTNGVELEGTVLTITFEVIADGDVSFDLTAESFTDFDLNTVSPDEVNLTKAKIYLTGDVDFDGEITILDSIKLAGYAKGEPVEDEKTEYVADVNFDSVITNADVAYLLSSIVGILQN